MLNKLVTALLGISAVAFPAQAARYLEISFDTSGSAYAYDVNGIRFDYRLSTKTIATIDTSLIAPGDDGIDLLDGDYWISLRYTTDGFDLYEDDGPQQFSASAGFDPIDLGGPAFDRLYPSAGNYAAGFIYEGRSGLEDFDRGVIGRLRVRGFDSDQLIESSVHTEYSAAPTPEPSTWGLMVIGFGAAGLAMRRRYSWALRR